MHSSAPNKLQQAPHELSFSEALLPNACPDEQVHLRGLATAGLRDCYQLTLLSHSAPRLLLCRPAAAAAQECPAGSSSSSNSSSSVG
jgi:hypothetical protein